MNNKMKLRVTGTSNGVQTEVKAGKHAILVDEAAQMGGKDAGANPLQYLLTALAGCENVTANFIAKSIDFDLQGISFDITGEFDPRGFMGDPNIRTYFETVTVTATVQTSESEERIEELQKLVEQRCPVYSTLKAASVNMKDNWLKA